MNASIKCSPVSQKQSYTFSVTIRENAGMVVVDWTSDALFEPDHGHIMLFLNGERVEWHKLGGPKGRRTYDDRTHGKGYHAAIVGRDFAGNDVDLVKTAVTQNHNDISAEKKYTFVISLANIDNQAQLQWSSDAPFRPRQSQAQVFEGDDVRERPWIEAAQGDQPTGLRWGVDLSAAYTAEDYSGKRIDVVRTSKTQ